jgi:hypothetical protein
MFACKNYGLSKKEKSPDTSSLNNYFNPYYLADYLVN